MLKDILKTPNDMWAMQRAHYMKLTPACPACTGPGCQTCGGIGHLVPQNQQERDALIEEATKAAQDGRLEAYLANKRAMQNARLARRREARD